MKLTNEEQQLFHHNKIHLSHTYSEIATTLGIDAEEVVKCSIGQDVSEDVYQAVKEWIA